MGSFFRFADTAFNGTGTKQAIGDYSGENAISFGIQPPENRIFKVYRVIAKILDGTSSDAGDYGAIAGGLENGIYLYKKKSGVVVQDITDGIPIKTNAGWGAFCFDVELKSWGVTSQFVLIRWTFAKSGGPITLNGGLEESLEFVINDDLTGLIDHTFMFHGLSFKRNTITG